MLPGFLVAALALASAALAAPTDAPGNATEVNTLCGSMPSAEYVASAEAHLAEHKVDPERGITKYIYVYFHVIYKDFSCVPLFSDDERFTVSHSVFCFALALAGGYIPSSQIVAQINRLNVDYFPTGFVFILAQTTRTYNVDWFNNAYPNTPQQTAMKKALRVGGAGALNLYSVGFVSGTVPGLLGYATFPWSYFTAPKDDGVVFRYSTVPGGTTANYNYGRVLTHEVGRRCRRSYHVD